MEWIDCKECIEFEDCENKESNDGCFFGVKEEDVEDDTMKGTPYPIMHQLQMRNFEIHEHFAEWGTGSISNYRKVKVYAPTMMTSLQDNKQHRAYYVEIEIHHAPGYIECDTHTEKQIYIREDKLVEFFIANEIFTKEEFNQKMEERRRRLKCQRS